MASATRDDVLVVFLREYNDIDHIVPVLYKWRTEGRDPVEVVLTGDAGLRGDYRLRFLHGLGGVRIRHVREIDPEDGPLERLYGTPTRTHSVVAKLVSAFPRLHRSVRRLRQTVRPRPAPSAEEKRVRVAKWLAAEVAAREAEADRLVRTLVDGADRAVIVFDWVFSPDTRAIVGAARRLGFATVSLPHGDRPFYHHMFTKDTIDYSRIRDPEEATVFDFLVVPNDFSALQWRRHPDPSRLKVLGSPRFNDEWLAVIDSLVPPYANAGAEGKLKCVVFLRGGEYPVFHEEVTRAIRLMLQFDEVYIVLKLHTRSRSVGKEVDSLAEFEHSDRVAMVGDEVHSTSLLNWADLVVDLGTSVCFEAVKKRVTVLSLDYVHANHTTLAHYFPSGEMKCRDHLYDAVERTLRHGTAEFYDEGERSRFLSEFIDVPDGDVLARYVDFLAKCMSGGPGAGAASVPAGHAISRDA